MSAHVNTEIISLLKQLNDQISTPKAQYAEADRLATIKTAQDLIRNLLTPQESITEISYNVFIESLYCTTFGNSHTTDSSSSPLIFCVSGSGLTWMFSKRYREKVVLPPSKNWHL